MTAAESQSRHRRLVREVPLLARLSEADVAALARLGHARAYPDRTVIFREGDAGDALHVVIEGRVRISVLSNEGQEVTLGFLEAGDCVGDLAVLDGGRRTATATTAATTRTFVVTSESFRAWLAERPGAATALLTTLALRLRRTDQVLADVSFLDLSHRLAKQLLQLSAATAAGPGPGSVRITQAELGTLLGVSRESVNKQLGAFQREGWVSLSRGVIILNDAQALRSL